MMKKNKLFTWKNALTSLKAMGVSIITGIVMIFPLWGSRWVMLNKAPVLGGIIGLGFILLYLLVWGFFANQFWKWK